MDIVLYEHGDQVEVHPEGSCPVRRWRHPGDLRAPYPDHADRRPQPPPLMTRRLASAVALILTALALYAPYLNRIMFCDEANTLYQYSQDLARALFSYATPNNHMLHSALVWTMTHLAGTSTVAVRFVGAGGRAACCRAHVPRRIAHGRCASWNRGGGIPDHQPRLRRFRCQCARLFALRRADSAADRPPVPDTLDHDTALSLQPVADQLRADPAAALDDYADRCGVRLDFVAVPDAAALSFAARAD